jgi:hypothetical protein
MSAKHTVDAGDTSAASVPPAKRTSSVASGVDVNIENCVGGGPIPVGASAGAAAPVDLATAVAMARAFFHPPTQTDTNFCAEIRMSVIEQTMRKLTAAMEEEAADAACVQAWLIKCFPGIAQELEKHLADLYHGWLCLAAHGYASKKVPLFPSYFENPALAPADAAVPLLILLTNTFGSDGYIFAVHEHFYSGKGNGLEITVVRQFRARVAA